MENLIERIETSSGELVIRQYEDLDTEAQADYFFKSPKDFLESIGFDPSKFKKREEWMADVRRRRAEAKAKGDPPGVVVAELGGRAVSMVFLGRLSPDGVPRLHFHIFDPALRGRGLGGLIFMAGVRAFSRFHGFQRFFIEPKASNERMNRLMRKLGFKHLQDYMLAAGPVTQEMMASQYEIVVPFSL